MSAPSSVSAASWPSATLLNAAASVHRPSSSLASRLGRMKSTGERRCRRFRPVGLEERPPVVVPWSSVCERKRRKNEREERESDTVNVKQKTKSSDIPRPSHHTLDFKSTILRFFISFASASL